MASLVNSIKHLRKKKSKQTLQNTEKEGIISTTFYEPNITLIPNKTKLVQENYRSVSLMNLVAKRINKILGNLTKQYIKGQYVMTK